MTITDRPAGTEWVYDRPDDDRPAQGHVLLTFRVHEEEGGFVGECVELGVTSCGDDVDEAFRATLEATALYLERLDANGERDWVLPERNVKVYDAIPSDDFSVGLTAHPGEFVSAQRFSVLARHL